MPANACIKYFSSIRRKRARYKLKPHYLQIPTTPEICGPCTPAAGLQSPCLRGSRTTPGDRQRLWRCHPGGTQSPENPAQAKMHFGSLPLAASLYEGSGCRHIQATLRSAVCKTRHLWRSDRLDEAEEAPLWSVMHHRLSILCIARRWPSLQAIDLVLVQVLPLEIKLPAAVLQTSELDAACTA